MIDGQESSRSRACAVTNAEKQQGHRTEGPSFPGVSGVQEAGAGVPWSMLATEPSAGP